MPTPETNLINSSDLVATDKTTHSFKGVSVVHEIHDGAKAFAHRISVLDFGVSDWVTYNTVSQLTIAANGTNRMFYATMDSWRGVFPECFEMVLPNT